MGTGIATVMAYYLVPPGEHARRLAASFSPTCIGGSMNYTGAPEA